MKALQFDKNSWHFQLVEKYCDGRNVEFRYGDICSYSRRVLIQSLKHIIIFLIGWLFLFVTCDTITYYVIQLIFNGVDYTANWSAVLGMLIWTGIGVVVGVGGGIIISMFIWQKICILTDKITNHVPTVKSPDFITEAWKAFHEKTCVKIEFVDKTLVPVVIPKELDELDNLDVL